jgi:thymidine kinase
MEQGKINLILGCMFSGKSTEIIRLIKRYKQIKKYNLLLINNSKDNRYGESVISSHDKEQIKCLSLNKLSDIKNTNSYKDCNVIFIEEGQFFTDLFDFCTQSADEDNKIIYVAGLDGDYQRKEFGQICKLVPHAETITKLKALCFKCGDGTEAPFTKRIVEENKIELVGSGEYYIPVCRKHFNINS